MGSFQNSIIFSEKVREYIDRIPAYCKKCLKDLSRLQNKIDGGILGWEGIKPQKLNI